MSKYSEKDISYFKTDLLKIRAKPQMYIGPTDDSGIFTILRECLDNAVDEARAGRNNLVHAFVTKEDFWVADEGVGIPVKKHPEAKISTLTYVLTVLQSSGKMKTGAYKSAIGTHGVGQKATNALSKLFEVWTYREDAGGWHYTKFASGEEKVAVKKAKAPKLPNGKTAKKGTVIRFVPDEKIFAKAKLDLKQLKTWCEITAFMNAGLHVKLDTGKNKHEWHSKKGISEYLDKRLVELKATSLNKKHVFCSLDNLEMALSFADVEGCEIQYYTNTIHNRDQGFHAEAFSRALVDSLKPFKGKLTYTPTDLKEGIVGILNYKIDAPQFSSQTKEKLVDLRVKDVCYATCLEVLSKFFAENKSVAKLVVQRAAELRSKTADFLKDKKMSRNIKNASKKLPAKLADCNPKCPVNKRELFLVEGDSAAGPCQRARFKDFQASFALKGKPLNVMETTKDKVNNNLEIASIFAGIGLDMSAKDPISKIRYGRIIILADADVDGKHINVLGLTVFWKYLPELIKQGRIFLVKSPLFRAKYKGKLYFGMKKSNIYKKCGTEKVEIQRLKGWGEVSEEELRIIAMNPETRTLYRILPPKDKQGAKDFQALMGKSSAFRQKLMGIS